MLARKNKKQNELSRNEFEVITEARNKYMNAFKNRSVNPSDFNTNIACLKELAEACHDWMAVIGPHMEERYNAEEKSRTSHFSFFRNRAREKALKELQLFDTAKKQMLDGVASVMKEQFIQEPRIISLNYNENHNRTESKKGKLIATNDKEVYTITFSDNSTLILNDLNPETINQARVKFTNKMEELAAAKQKPEATDTTTLKFN